jgi:YfiH family protein
VSLHLLALPDWPANVVAGFTTRDGGLSRAPYDSFNLAAHVGDAAEAVDANRRQLAAALPAALPVQWLQQVHGTDVVRAADPLQVPEADAAWTTAPGIACAVLVADCLPVLLCRRDGSAVAAVHAGWRGLAAGVLEKTATAMGNDSGELLAWLGPCIGRCHFRVGREVADALAAGLSDLPDSSVADCFAAADEPGFCRADLQALATLRLRRLGITRVSAETACTYCDEARFFSYRRDGDTGRMAALIALRDPASPP